MAQSGANSEKCLRVVQNGARLLKMVESGANGAKWLKVLQDCVNLENM